MFTVVNTVEVPEERVTNCLVGAFEFANCCSWIGSVEPSPEAARLGYPGWYSEGDSMSVPGWGFTVHFDGGDDDEGTFKQVKNVGWHDFQKALSLMASEETAHFNDLINYNDDAITHDILMQLLLLGEVIYG